MQLLSAVFNIMKSFASVSFFSTKKNRIEYYIKPLIGMIMFYAPRICFFICIQQQFFTYKPSYLINSHIITGKNILVFIMELNSFQ